MATATTIKLEAGQKPAFYVDGIGEESAKLTSKLLQENLERHHIFFNQSGFHNHIVHHLLTLFALKATPKQIQKAYDYNSSYQRSVMPLESDVVDDMHKPERFKTYLGKDRYYRDFMVFFQGEIEKKGWEDVVNEYVFKGDERADDMLVRMFAGFLHPIIHLGFGIEFSQPAIIAEALAQAAVHDVWIGKFFLEAENAVKNGERAPQETRSLVHLLQEIRGDEKLKRSAHWDDGNKIRDGILKRAPDEMIKFASQYVIPEGQLEERTAEMINATVYYTACAQHPPSQIKFDFFLMHAVNCSIFFSSFLGSSFLSPANKVRLLEWKARVDLALYVSRGCPPLSTSHITSYTPSRNPPSEWSEMFERVSELPDDGHASKLLRALAHGEQACKKFEDKEGFVIKGTMWKTIGNMAIDSVEAGEPKWVRSCGFEQAWAGVPERKSARL